MKLSDTTLDILKNFSGINPNILFKTGSTLSTIAEAKNIVATAQIEEKFPRDFGVYDLTEFIAALSLMDSADLEFGSDSVTITDGNASVKFFYSPAELLTVPGKTISMPKCELKLLLSEDVISRIKKAASVLGHATFEISGKSGVVTLSVLDQKNVTANRYSIIVDKENECKEPFSFVMVIGNLKLIPGDYEVSISSKFISHFKNKSTPVEFYIALEKTSTFGS